MDHLKSGTITAEWKIVTVEAEDGPYDVIETMYVWDLKSKGFEQDLYVRSQIRLDVLEGLSNPFTVIQREIVNSLVGGYRTAQAHGVVPKTPDYRGQ